tara:strand:+ start:924 stop:1031 length:108 start_codon:yes stop_codon:yes gene_type:complete
VRLKRLKAPRLRKNNMTVVICPRKVREIIFPSAVL